MATQPSTQALPPARATLFEYGVVTVILAATSFAVLRITSTVHGAVAREALVPPLAGMLALVAVVWLLMGTVRNLLVALGKVSMRYYHQYAIEAPSEKVERPARTFNNLMQLPQIFYAVCLLAMAVDRVDGSDVQLAWLFVALRVLHALILMLWNHVPYRFGVYASGGVALAALSYRILERCWPV